jgi:hypothetical protein
MLGGFLVSSSLTLYPIVDVIIGRYVETGNETLLPTIHTLHETDLMRKRQKDGMSAISLSQVPPTYCNCF